MATLHVRSEARLMKPACGNEGSFIMCKSLRATEQTMSRNPLLDSNRADLDREPEAHL